MSLEARVTTLEDKSEALEDAHHEFKKIIGATHDVVTLALKEQRERFAVMEYRLEQLEKDNRENHELHKETHKHIHQLELLIRQLIPNTH